MNPTPRYILAPYVATPEDVVERMVQLADVRETDLVFDLGCGDGRLAIAAAQMRGAQALGVDIETYWIEQARENALKAGVQTRVRFEACDAMALDLRPATVLFLYLVEWSTRRVGEELLRQCVPGTRVVSHSFVLDGLPEAKTEHFIDASGQARRIHCAVIG